MFTGLITETTDIVDNKQTDLGLRLTFRRPEPWDDLEEGESIATDGVCLTVENLQNTTYSCLLMPETLSKTTFGQITPARVNLERALRASDRLGGHFVQGHVDCVGKVTQIQKDDGWRVNVEFPVGHSTLVIPKGSITINGVSLTVADLAKNTLTVALIPHTLEHTTLGVLKPGDSVNLEFDVLGKYAAKARSGG